MHSTNSRHQNLLIAFCDLTNFRKLSQLMVEEELFGYLSDFYEITGKILEEADGRVVKFIGDAALVVFPEESVDPGMLALRRLKQEIDRMNAERRIDSRLIIKAHFGRAMTGMLGTAGDKRFDVIGSEVNVAAGLKSMGFAISVQAFRQLSPETRRLFKKHTPPVTYIDVNERHRD